MRVAYPLEDCGLFYYVGPKKLALPLDGVHVSVRLVNLVAEVQVVQFYETIDTKYTFPLDESAAVCGFEAELEDKLLIGEVREKQEARAEYNAAIARGETAALLEQDKPDVFTQRIGNIRPYSRVNIRVTYVADLKVESDGAIRFVLPTSVAPRYSPYGPSYEGFVDFVPWKRNWRKVCLGRRVLYHHDYDRWCRRGTYVYEELPFYTWNYYTPEYVVNRDKPCSFSVTVEVEMPSTVTDMASPTHTMKWERGSDPTLATASFWYDTEPMGKDLVLRVYQEKPHEPHAQIEIGPDGGGCAMVTMVPEFDMEPEPTEIVFLVDCSGSMSGNRIQAANRALQVFLRALPMNCHFNIIRFGSSSNSLFSSGSQPYTESTLQSASDLVSKTTANLGGTEILRPLNGIFNKPVAGGGRARQVFVLTDGQVSNTAQVIEACRRNAHNSRVFTVGIGDEVSRDLVEGMARAATGTAQFIVGSELQGNSGSLESKLLNQLKLATQPSLTKIHIDWGQLSKASPPTFFAAEAPAASTPVASTPATSSGPQVTPTSTPTPSSLPANAGDASLLTIKVRCSDTTIGEQLFITGDNTVFGSWDPSKATLMTVDSSSGEDIWAASLIVPTGTTLAFKFIKKKLNGQSSYESFDGNRSLIVGNFTESVFDAGKWNEKSAASPAASAVPATSAPTPVGQHSVHMGSGVMMTGPGASSASTAAPAGRPVSKFFQTGPAQKSGNSANSIGTGTAFHSPSSLAPAVAAGHNVSDVQGHARNGELYQAPFLPPPIFSNTRFVMYAFFAPNALPTNFIRITAESPDGPMDIDVPITKLQTVGKTLHVLGAKTLVRDLEEGTSHLHWRKTNLPASLRGGGSGEEKRHWFSSWLKTEKAVGGKGQDRGSAWGLEPVTPPAHVVKQEIVDLGLRFGIVSSQTSFVAVERWSDGRSGSSMEALAVPSAQRAPVLSAPKPSQQQQYQQQQQQYQQPLSSPQQFFASPPSVGGAMLRGRGGPPAPPVACRSSSFAPPPSAPSMSQCFSAAPAGPPPAHFEADRCRKKKASLPVKSEKCKERRSSPRSFSLSKAQSYDDEEEQMELCSDMMEKSCDTLIASSSSSALPLGPPPTALFMQQKFDGSFEINATLAGLLQTTMATLSSGASAAATKFGNLDEATARRVWASLFVVAMLLKLWGSYESTWEMTADKAKQFCVKTLSQSLGDRTVARRLVDDLVAEI